VPGVILLYFVQVINFFSLELFFIHLWKDDKGYAIIMHFTVSDMGKKIKEGINKILEVSYIAEVAHQS